MTQFIVAKNNEGIVLAADSRGYDFDLQGGMQEVTVEPLVQLGQNTAILAGGDADGVEVINSLANFIQAENLTETSDIALAALPFLNAEYEKIMRRKCDCLPIDPVHHMYFILAGLNVEKEPKFQVDLIWSRKKLPQLDREEIKTAFSIPRLIGFEYKLATKISEGISLDDLSSLISQEFQRLQDRKDSLISPPIHMATITSQGMKK